MDHTSADSRASTVVEGKQHDQEETSTSGIEKSNDTDIEVAVADLENEYKEVGRPRDANTVDWDGPNDPENPMNWSMKQKLVMIACISIITFITPLGSSMFAPGVADVMKEFKSRSPELASFVVSVYLLGYAFGPLIIAPMSELYGRSPAYAVCNILFVIFNVACAVANSLGSLIVFRLLAGMAGSAPLTLGAGSIADMVVQEKRGASLALWALGPLLGPVIGPIAGGYLTEAKGWRWTFWLLAILSGVVTIISLIIMRESYHPVLLKKKTKRLIKETGNKDLKSVLDTGVPPRQLFTQSIVRPTKMLMFSPIVLLLSVYVAVVYGYLYLLFTTITPIFQKQYHFSQGNVGLAFLGIGIGCILGLAVLSVTLDRSLKILSAKTGEMKPEYRLPLLIPGGLCLPIGLFWYGWTAEHKLHYILPIIGTFFVGVGMIISMMTTSTYLVDAYTVHAASAIAASTLFRSAVGAVLPLAGVPMYTKLGLGWGNSLLAFIALALVPLPVIFFRYGEGIRTSKRFQVTF